MTQLEFLNWAVDAVRRQYPWLTSGNIAVVWYCKTLQNHKAILTVVPASGTIFEFTYNGDKKEAYLDEYQKWNNTVFHVETEEQK